MNLPTWATPLDPNQTLPACDCDHAFLAVARIRVTLKLFPLKYDICPVCVVYEREVRGEITYLQAERWAARLVRVLEDRRLHAETLNAQRAAIVVKSAEELEREEKQRQHRRNYKAKKRMAKKEAA